MHPTFKNFRTTLRSNAIWLVIFGAVILVYLPALSNFFAQDDFTHLNISRAENIQGVVKFFQPVSSAIFYRPLSIQIYTWLSRLAFGLNPLGWHLVALGFHLANVYLVYRLLNTLRRSRVLALTGALFYGVHVSHFMSLFWIAEFSMVLAPFFAFLSIQDFIEKHYWRFWLWMGLGLLSNELAAAVPFILGVYVLFRREWRRLVWLSGPLLGVTGLVLLRFVWVPTSLGTEYGLAFSSQLLWNNLRWQLFRAFGLPEAVRAHWDMFPVKLSLAALSLAVISWFGLLIGASRRPNKWKRNNLWLVAFGVAWFTLALMPVLFLSHHQSPIYQIIGLPGFFLIMAGLMPEPRKLTLYLWIFAGLYFVASFWGVRAQDQYHWVTKRGRLAKYHLEKLQNHQPQPGERVEFLNTEPQSSTQVYLALAGEKGVKAFFGDEVTAEFEDFTDTVLSPAAIYVLSRVEME